MKPSIQEQISYIKDLRDVLDSGADVYINPSSRMHEMFRAIHENLIAVKLWNDANARAVNTGSKLLEEDVYEELRTFIATVAVMRKKQKEYFKTRTSEALILSKDFEKKVDNALAIIVQKPVEFPPATPSAIQKPVNDCTREEATNG